MSFPIGRVFNCRLFLVALQPVAILFLIQIRKKSSCWVKINTGCLINSHTEAVIYAVAPPIKSPPEMLGRL